MTVQQMKERVRELDVQMDKALDRRDANAFGRCHREQEDLFRKIDAAERGAK